MIAHINFINYQIAIAGGSITRHDVVLYDQDGRTNLIVIDITKPDVQSGVKFILFSTYILHVYLDVDRVGLWAHYSTRNPTLAGRATVPSPSML